MNYDKIQAYNNWTINYTHTFSAEKPNFFATIELDGVRRVIGVDSRGIHTLDRNNPSEVENGIHDVKELIKLIDEKGDELINDLREEIEFKNLELQYYSKIEFEAKGMSRFNELRTKKYRRAIDNETYGDKED